MTRPSPTLRSWILPAFLLTPLLAACSDDAAGTGGGPSGSPSATSSGTGEGPSGTGGAGNDDVKSGACEAGDAYDCKIHNAFGCIMGRQDCVDGQWGDCRLASPGPAAEGDYIGDGVREGLGDGIRLRGGGGAGGGGGSGGGAPASPEPCDGSGDVSNNPCDPACQGFDLDPPTFGGGYPADWEAGSFNGFPPAFLNAGLPNNCDEDANENDCQYDHRCVADGTNGSCEPWPPGETDPNCAGQVNVTIGLACANGIPVCNRGTVPMEDDFHFDHESAPPTGTVTPSDMISGDPNIGNDPGGSNCDYVVGTPPAYLDGFGPIPPGECVMLPFDCGTPGDTSDDLLEGQFITAHNPNNECNNGDNWSFIAPGATTAACSGPICDGAVSGVSSSPVTLFLALDLSGSMDFDLVSSNGCDCYWWGCDSNCTDDPPSRLDTVRPALIDFVEAPESAGLGVVTRFWPSDSCGSTSCDAISPFEGVVPAGACAHSPCTAGATLSDGCSAEVTATCADAPRCCGLEPSGGCAHSPCSTGAALANGCNSIVSEVCTTGQAEFRRCCGLNEGTCDRNPCVAQAPGVHMGDIPGPPGSCNNGFGVPTANSGNGQIADVCNDAGFGYCCATTLQAPAPATITTAWGANASVANFCADTNVNLGMRCRNGSNVTVDCETITPPAGTLADRLKSFCALPGNATCCRDAAADVDLWTAGTCGANFRAYWLAQTGNQLCGTWDAACAAQYVAKDPSACDFQWDAACVTEYADEDDDAGGGLEEPDSCNKTWDQACIDTFVAAGSDPWACTTGDACNRPTVPTGCVAEGSCPTVLPTGEADLVAAFTSATAAGGTPSYIAMLGATDYCINFEAQRPGERCVVVFISDGEPSTCGPGGDHQDAVIAVADQAYSSEGIYSFAIGIPGGNNTFMDEIAIAGGTGTDGSPGAGTDDAFIIPANGTATAALLDALNAIKNSFACDFTIEAVSDLDLITVQWNDGSGSPPEVTRVAGTDDTNCVPCADPDNCLPSEFQYYMPSDTEIRLCPGTCDAITGDLTNNLEVAVGCEDPPSGGNIQAFSADGACDSIPGTYPKWTVMYYDATITGSSFIGINARTSIVAGGTMRDWHPVDMRPNSVANVQNMTSAYPTSDLSDPPSLEAALLGEAYGEELELQFVVDASGGTPVLNDYEVHFTCAFSE